MTTLTIITLLSFLTSLYLAYSYHKEGRSRMAIAWGIFSLMEAIEIGYRLLNPVLN